jgi:glyoxylase I family protein
MSASTDTPSPGIVDFDARRQELCRAYLKDAAERPVSNARGVHHLALICSDVEQTVRFYQDLLGFPLVEMFENRDYPGSTHFFMDIGNDNLLAFFDFPGLGLGAAVEAHGGVQHIALSVSQEAFDLLKVRLDESGIEYLGPDRGLTRSMYLKDPDGIQIELLAEPLRIMDDRYLG